MCIFCKLKTINEEKEKHFIEFCENCNGKIVSSKKGNVIVVSKFPKKDIICTFLFYSPYFIIGFLLLFVFIGRIFIEIEAQMILRILFIEIIILTIMFILRNFKNILNYRKSGYIYFALNSVKTKDRNMKFSKFLYFWNYFAILFYVYFIFTICRLMYFGIL
jgi:hypothetical protein